MPGAAGVQRCGTQVCLPLADPANASLRAVDGARLINIDGKQLLVARIEQASFIVLSAVCTHMGCIVNYSPAQADIECPCHGARFQLDGAVKLGPASSPLKKYTATYDAATDTVTVTLP